jgi:uncharacterized membrane protein YfcA
LEFSDAAALTLLIFVAAALYSSVGHAGASGYLAAMALFGVAPGVMKPTALALNILVAAIAFAMFFRTGSFSWQVLRPFAIGAVPFAFIGGGVALPGSTYKVVVGVVLVYAAARLFLTTRRPQPDIREVPVVPALVIGAAIGFLSGLTGVGGGIFLSPILLFTGWADAKTTAGVSSAFILVNSIAGLLGHASTVALLPAQMPVWAVAAASGGFLGSRFGSGTFSGRTIRLILSAVLLIAGLKMIFT